MTTNGPRNRTYGRGGSPGLRMSVWLLVLLVFGSSARADALPATTGRARVATGQALDCENPPAPADYPVQPAVSVADPTVTGPVEGGSRTGEPYSTTLVDLDSGWVEEEFFVEGLAKDAGGQEASYKTRIILRRPSDPCEFNGTVVFDWNNVSVPDDTDVAWPTIHRTVLKRGFVYVGVAAQYLSIEGTPTGLKLWDPVRYGSLIHPGDLYSFDIFSQAAEAVLDPTVLRELRPFVERRLAMGASQSGSRLLTYINEWHEEAGVFDGFQPQMSSPVGVRRDLVPVLWVNSQSEGELEVPGTEYEADTDLFRLWEIAGPAHISNEYSAYTRAVRLYAHTNGTSGNTFDYDTTVAWGYQLGAGECAPQNYFPPNYAWSAALVALDDWVRTGTPPAPAPRWMRDDSGARVYDEYGNVVGGIRNPIVDVPIATYYAGGSPSPGACSTPGGSVPLAGFTEVFTAAMLDGLYGCSDVYLDHFSASVQEGLARGFVLAEGAEDLLQRAPEVSALLGDDCPATTPTPEGREPGSAPSEGPSGGAIGEDPLPATGGGLAALAVILLAGAHMVRRRRQGTVVAGRRMTLSEQSGEDEP